MALKLINLERSQALELTSIGLVASGLSFPKSETSQLQLVERVRELPWPEWIQEYFMEARPIPRPGIWDYSKARAMLQASAFTEKPFTEFKLEAYRKEVEAANLTRAWISPPYFEWVGHLAEVLQSFESLPSVADLQPAFAFAYQTQQLKYMQAMNTAQALIDSFSLHNPSVERIIVHPNPLQIPGECFIRSSSALHIMLGRPDAEMVLSAYLHQLIEKERMRLFSLAWKTNIERIIDYSAFALKGISRDQSFEGTIMLAEESIVKSLIALISPATISEKRSRLEALAVQGYTAAREFKPMAGFPVFENEVADYIQRLIKQ